MMRAALRIRKVFGPPGTEAGSVSQRYGYGSVFFNYKAKIVRKPLIPVVL
jgi:hypothetical protein